jgi:hypothetical protein
MDPAFNSRAVLRQEEIKRRLECVASGGPELREPGREGIPNSNLLGRDGERKGAAELDRDFLNLTNSSPLSIVCAHCVHCFTSDIVPHF